MDIPVKEINSFKLGTEPHKLHRKDSPETSKEAAYSVDTTYLEEAVLTAIRSVGQAGANQDDVLSCYPNLPYSSVTARFKALAEKGYIYYKGDKRKGRSGRPQRIMRVNRRVNKQPYRFAWAPDRRNPPNSEE